MTRDFLLIDIPVFVPEYDENKEYGWNKFKDNLWDLLKNTTKGYCMYCYDSIWINGQRRGQIEHGIEKVNLPERLEDCVPNLGIACENCNMKYKKRGEMQRRLPPQSIKEFGEGECLRFSCKAPCGLPLLNRCRKEGFCKTPTSVSQKHRDPRPIHIGR